MVCEKDLVYLDGFCWDGMEGPNDDFSSFMVSFGGSSMDLLCAKDVLVEILSFGRPVRGAAGWSYTCCMYVRVYCKGVRVWVSA